MSARAPDDDPLLVLRAVESAAATEAARLLQVLEAVDAPGDAAAVRDDVRRLTDLLGWLAAGEERLLRLTLDRHLVGAGDPYRFDQGALAAATETVLELVDAVASGEDRADRLRREALLLHDRLIHHAAKVNALLVPAAADLLDPGDRIGAARDAVGALPPGAWSWVWPLVVETTAPDRVRPVVAALLEVLLPTAAGRVREILRGSLSEERRAALGDLLDAS